MAGHWRVFDEQAESFPYLMYDAINDSRVRPSHLALDGVIRPVNDPFWKSRTPPLGHRCRCTLRSLTPTEARERGGVTQSPPIEGQPDKGWGSDPREWDSVLGRLGAEKAAKAPGAVREAFESVSAKNPIAPLTVPDFKTTKEANAWAVANNVADHADFTGAKPEVAKEWLQSLADHMHEFPALRANQKFTGTCQAQMSRWWEIEVTKAELKIRAKLPAWQGDYRAAAELLVKKRKVESTTYAHSWASKNVSGVAVNKAWGSDPAKLHERLAKDVTLRHHPVGCDTIRSVADHEMAHQLDDLLGLHVDANVVALYHEAKRLGMEQEVSKYAETSVKEFVAECWAEARNNTAPRRFAQWVEDIVRSKYAAQYP
jgi:hypothetical protein